MALLEVRGLHVQYAGAQALGGVDLVVPANTVVALLGANGAGKSTLLRTVAGLVQPSAGAIFLRGERIDGRPAHELSRKGICLIPEGRGIFPRLTVAHNLRTALDDDPEAIARVVERFSVLGRRMDQVAGTLSGGEQQMLALARAVARPSALLAVDEPSLGLAPRLVEEVAAQIEDLHRRDGRTILLVEQHVTHALRLARIVYILARGRVAWAGESDELRASKVLAEAYLGAEV